jgi:nitrate reductase delta subunit
MGDATAVAQAFRYPRPGSLEELRSAAEGIEHAPAAKAMQSFVGAIEKLELSAWEELHTATVDLSPKFVPYVGHAVWGENYRRGAFMADLSREMRELGVDLQGELPDHLDPILRYLDGARDPLGDVVEVLPQALMRMEKELAKAEKKNPYRHAIVAARLVAEELIETRRKAVT